MTVGFTRRDFIKLGGLASVAALCRPVQLFARALAIPVLMYHDISDWFDDGYTISPATFAAQMEWLHADGYRAVSLRDVGARTTPPEEKTVVITFDDGYASFMDYAFPLLREYGFKATINIIGRAVGSYIHFDENRPLLAWDEYRYLARSGLIDLGCHTFDRHKRSSAAAAPDKSLKDDLLLFREVFQREIGGSTDILAWPYGIYRPRHIAIAKKVGFRYLLTSDEGFFTGDYREKIPRLNINSRLDLVSFRQYIGAL